MSIWTSIRRAMGGTDARHWRVSPWMVMRLRGDARWRLALGALVGLGAGGPFLAVLVATAPREQLGWAVLLGLALIAVFGILTFLWQDVADFTVTLEEGGIRRRIKPLLANPFGTRGSDEFWEYRTIAGCGIVTAESLGASYAALVLAVPGRAVTLLIPARMDVRAIATFLAGHGVRVQPLAQIPPHALPPPSVGARGLRIGAVLAAGGVVLALAGGGARLFLHRGGGRVVNAGDAQAALKATAAIAARRELTDADGGVMIARVSSDGGWVWAHTNQTKKHLIWGPKQAQPVGEIPLPAAHAYRGQFTDDNRRFVVCADQECQIWNLEPLDKVASYQLRQTPDALALSHQGKLLVAVTMTAIHTYELESGQHVKEFPITLGAIVGAAMTADDQRVSVVQQTRILSVSLRDGAIDELIAFSKPQPLYLFGSLSANGQWAALQGRQGTDVFDFSGRRFRPSIAAGPIYAVPAVSDDGATLVVPAATDVGVWDTTTGQPKLKLTAGPVGQIVLSAGGRHVVGFASGQTKLAVWELP